MRLALLILLAFPCVAYAGPVVAFLGTAIAGTSITVGQVLFMVAMTAYGAAQQKRMEKRAREKHNASLQDRTATIISTDASLRYVVGQTRVGSDVVAVFDNPGKRFKLLVCVHAAHECESIDEIYIAGKALGPLDSAGAPLAGEFVDVSTHHASEIVTSLTYELSYEPKPGTLFVTRQTQNGEHGPENVPYTLSGKTLTLLAGGAGDTYATYQYTSRQPRVWVRKHLGAPGQAADADLISWVPDKWTSAHKMSGLAYTFVTLDLLHPEFQSGMTSVEVVKNGMLVYDFRTGNTVWTRNPVLVLYWYLTSELCNVDPSDFPMSRWIAAANVCDETITFMDGSTGPRYTVDGDIRADQSQDKVIQDLCKAMAGDLERSTWNIYAGTYVAPVLSLSQEDVVGKIVVLPGPEEIDIFNTVRGSFFSPGNTYVATDYKPYFNADYLNADGAELATNIDFPFTNSEQRIHNIARILMEDQREGYTIQAEFSLKAFAAKFGDRITFTSEFFGHSNKVFRVIARKFKPGSIVELTLKEDAPQIWDQADAVTTDDVPNTDLANPFEIGGIDSLSASSGDDALLIMSDGSVVSRIKLQWPLVSDASVTTNGVIEIEWIKTSSDAWQTMQVAGSETMAYLSPVQDGWPYTIRARCWNPTLNTRSDWSYAYETVQGKSIPPATPTGLVAAPVGSQLRLAWAKNVEVDLAGYEVRTTDTGWGDGGYLFRGDASTCLVHPGALGATNTWYLRAYDTSGNYAVVSATVNYTVTAPPNTASVAATFADTSLTNATVTLDWPNVVPTFGLAGFTVTYGAVVKRVTATTITLPVDWTGVRAFTVRTVDGLGNESTGTTVNVTKSLPAAPTSGVAAVDQGTLSLSWTTPVKTTLPVWGCEVRVDTAFGTANPIFKGQAANCQIDGALLSLGVNAFYVAAIDTDGNYSSAYLTINYTVVAPVNTAAIVGTFADTSLTNATFTLDWDDVEPVFGLDAYTVEYGSITKRVKATTITLPADWIGTRTFTVRTIDGLGNISSGRTLNVAKLVPAAPTGGTATASQGSLSLGWSAPAKTTLPVMGYEVRKDVYFGGPNPMFKGSAAGYLVAGSDLLLGANAFYVAAIDTDGNYSSTYLTINYTVVAPPDIDGITESFADTSLTNATVTLDWDDVEPVFGLSAYRVNYPGVSKTVKSNTITLPANWVGSRTFTIQTIDALGNASAGFEKAVTKLAPNPITNFRSQVIDNNVLLHWDLPGKTTLPIAHVHFKKGDTWATAADIGTKDGTFTSLQELAAAHYTYWAAVVDTDGIESEPVSITAQVSQPPDFRFNASYESTFSATKSSAIVDTSTLLLPVNTTETWAQHFSSKGWASPQAQINAGFPIYIQPGASSGYYEEVFDYGSILGSSQITVSIGGAALAGAPTLSTIVSVSADGVGYTDHTGVTSVFATNFRFVKVRVNVAQNAAGDIYQVNSLNVRLDAKQKTDGGRVDALSADSAGTLANFSNEFVDIESITLTPQGTAARSAVYDFNDTVISGTYTLASNVCTVNAIAHNLVAGQRVRLSFTTGTAPNGVYEIASVTNANSYKVNITAANTGGNVSTYAQGMRIYLFDMTGARVSGTVSWAVRGY